MKVMRHKEKLLYKIVLMWGYKTDPDAMEGKLDVCSISTLAGLVALMIW